jgi:hypothetical protein
MGRKGVSKRKRKQLRSGANDNNNRGSSHARPGESSSPVQALVNAKGAPLRKEGTNPSAGSNKTNREGR